MVLPIRPFAPTAILAVARRMGLGGPMTAETNRHTAGVERSRNPQGTDVRAVPSSRLAGFVGYLTLAPASPGVNVAPCHAAATSSSSSSTDAVDRCPRPGGGL